MNNSEPGATFRGLPLTPEQDSEIRHYIHLQMRNGAPWDTPELKAMLHDMLDPPELADEDRLSLGNSMAAERTAAVGAQDVDGERPLS